MVLCLDGSSILPDSTSALRSLGEVELLTQHTSSRRLELRWTLSTLPSPSTKSFNFLDLSQPCFNTMKMFQQIIYFSLLSSLFIGCGYEEQSVTVELNDTNAIHINTEEIVGDWIGDKVYLQKFDSVHGHLEKRQDAGNSLQDYRITEDSIFTFYYPYTKLKRSKFEINNDSIRLDHLVRGAWDNNEIIISGDTMFLSRPAMFNGDVYTFSLLRGKFKDQELSELEPCGINKKYLSGHWSAGHYNRYKWLDSIPFTRLRFFDIVDDSIRFNNEVHPIEIDNKQVTFDNVPYIMEMDDENTLHLHLLEYLDKRWTFIYRKTSEEK
jgi:hypothetical protein